jgi:hypothetical protein
MTRTAWDGFSAARDEFRTWVDELDKSLPNLRAAQQALVDSRPSASFTVETAVVYNKALDELGPEAEPRIILVADNPGRREQVAMNRRYLVGPSGKLADGFFRAHPELGIDFYRNVLILNKTPIHTPRTAELRELMRLGGPDIAKAIVESQQRMASLIHRFHLALGSAQLWIIGYSELGKGKLFEPFSAAMARAYGEDKSSIAAAANIFLFRHFSMNQFSADIRKRTMEGENSGEALRRIGSYYRERELGTRYPIFMHGPVTNED